MDFEVLEAWKSPGKPVGKNPPILVPVLLHGAELWPKNLIKNRSGMSLTEICVNLVHPVLNSNFNTREFTAREICRCFSRFSTTAEFGLAIRAIFVR